MNESLTPTFLLEDLNQQQQYESGLLHPLVLPGDKNNNHNEAATTNTATATTTVLCKSTSMTSLLTVSDGELAQEDAVASSSNDDPSNNNARMLVVGDHDSTASSASSLSAATAEEQPFVSTDEDPTTTTNTPVLVETKDHQLGAHGAPTTLSSTTSTQQRRADVQLKVQQTWRTRREERDLLRGEHNHKNGGGVSSGASVNTITSNASHNNHKTKKPSSHKQQPPIMPPRTKQSQQPAPSLFPLKLCAVVQKTWNQTFDKGKEQTKAKKSKGERPKVFPSMLNILEANALVRHVKELQDDDDEEEDDNNSILEEGRVDPQVSSEESTVRSSDSPRDQAPTTTTTTKVSSAGAGDAAALQSVLSILPAGYNWNAAILQMAQSRSRAFVLLDLAAIVRRNVIWKRLHPAHVTWVHTVSSNADHKLLQVLLMANVKLATATRSDIVHARLAYTKLKKKLVSDTIWMADSTSHVAPPDSYIRELVVGTMNSTATTTRLTVDGPSEVHRIAQTVQRIQARHSKSSDRESAPPVTLPLELILRLPSLVVDTTAPPSAKWMTLVESTVQAVQQYPNHRLAGISFDVGLNEQGQVVDKHCEMLQQCAEQVADYIVQHQNKDDDGTTKGVRIHLTGFDGLTLPTTSSGVVAGMSDPFPTQWVQWWTNIRKHHPGVCEIAVECSYPLIASAGALCTRIIGIREHETATATPSSNDSVLSSNSGDDQSMGTLSSTQATTKRKKQSLYIDDGCYGSLYQTRGDLHPIPLGNYNPNHRPHGSTNSTSTGPEENQEQVLYSTTVWGPTCDGLDRVCQDIALPKLERDDWLVFPNLGCPGGLGTAFNGFEPPDTAYCVLGYFK